MTDAERIDQSGTILPDLLPGAILLSSHGETGVYNLASLMILLYNSSRCASV